MDSGVRLRHRAISRRQGGNEDFNPCEQVWIKAEEISIKNDDDICSEDEEEVMHDYPAVQLKEEKDYVDVENINLSPGDSQDVTNPELEQASLNGKEKGKVNVSSLELMRERKRSEKFNKRQVRVLVNYMVENKEFGCGRLYGPLEKRGSIKRWEELSSLLAEYGPKKTVEQWRRCWKDIKSKTRVKNARINSERLAPGNVKRGSAGFLNDVDQKVLSVIGANPSSEDWCEATDEEQFDRLEQSSPADPHFYPIEAQAEVITGVADVNGQCLLTRDSQPSTSREDESQDTRTFTNHHRGISLRDTIDGIQKRVDSSDREHIDGLKEIANAVKMLAGSQDRIAASQERIASTQEKIADGQEKLAASHEIIAATQEMIAKALDKIASFLGESD